MKMLIYIISYLGILLLIPLFDSILKSIKAKLQGERTIPLFQTYNTIWKLFHKNFTQSPYTSIISMLAPLFILAINVIFLFLVPTISHYFDANIIVLFSLLGFSAFMLMLYGLDNATYFGGLGTQREAYSLFIMEGVVMLLFLIFALFDGGGLTLNNIAIGLHSLTGILSVILLGFLIIIFLTILLLENKRFPFDNPSTHLELTMIHEAMLLETTGPQLAIMEIAAKFTLFAFIGLFIYIFLPFNFGITSLFLLFGLFLLKIVVVLFLISFIEIFISKMRIFRYHSIFVGLLMLEFFLVFFYFLL